MTRQELEQVREWADTKIATGEEPPWAWFQYMKLREVLDQILAGGDAVRTESSQQSERPSGTGPRLAVSNTLPSTSQPHLQVVVPQMPT